jgi:hypothetical protein
MIDHSHFVLPVTIGGARTMCSVHQSKQVGAKESFHLGGTSIFDDNLGHCVQIAGAVSIVIPSVRKAVTNVVHSLVHEGFFRAKVCSQKIHSGTVGLRIRPAQSFSEQAFAGCARNAYDRPRDRPQSQTAFWSGFSLDHEHRYVYIGNGLHITLRDQSHAVLEFRFF